MATTFGRQNSSPVPDWFVEIGTASTDEPTVRVWAVLPDDRADLDNRLGIRDRVFGFIRERGEIPVQAYVSFWTAAETGGRVHSEIPAHQGRRCTGAASRLSSNDAPTPVSISDTVLHGRNFRQALSGVGTRPVRAPRNSTVDRAWVGFLGKARRESHSDRYGGGHRIGRVRHDEAVAKRGAVRSG